MFLLLELFSHRAIFHLDIEFLTSRTIVFQVTLGLLLSYETWMGLVNKRMMSMSFVIPLEMSRRFVTQMDPQLAMSVHCWALVQGPESA